MKTIREVWDVYVKSHPEMFLDRDCDFEQTRNLFYLGALGVLAIINDRTNTTNLPSILNGMYLEAQGFSKEMLEKEAHDRKDDPA